MTATGDAARERSRERRVEPSIERLGSSGERVDLMKKKFVLAALVLCAGVIVAVRAYAGYKSVQPVYVYSSGGNQYAYGNLSDTRNSSDSNEFISCYVLLYLSQTGSMGSVQYGCQAENATGTYIGCYGNDPAVAQYIASGIKGDSYVEFSANQNDNCTYVQIEQSSAIAPKGP
jgi:hypothetical protein